MKYKEEVIRPLVEPVSADTTDASLSFNEFLKVFVVVNMILIFVSIVMFYNPKTLFGGSWSRWNGGRPQTKTTFLLSSSLLIDFHYDDGDDDDVDGDGDDGRDPYLTIVQPPRQIQSFFSRPDSN